MFVLIKEVVFVEWFRIRKIPVRIPRNFKLNSENSEKSSINCSAQLWQVDETKTAVIVVPVQEDKTKPSVVVVPGQVHVPAVVVVPVQYR